MGAQVDKYPKKDHGVEAKHRALSALRRSDEAYTHGGLTLFLSVVLQTDLFTSPFYSSLG